MCYTSRVLNSGFFVFGVCGTHVFHIHSVPWSSNACQAFWNTLIWL